LPHEGFSCITDSIAGRWSAAYSRRLCCFF